MDILFIIVYALLGLSVGSFLNLCSDRLPEDQSIVHPSSHCPICGNAVAAVDLVPFFNYLWLRGRCRYCRTHIPLRSPIVELTTGVIFAFLYWQYHESNIELAFALIYASLLIVIFITDFEQQLILDKVTYPGMVIMFVFSFFRAGIDPMEALLGGATGFGIMFFLYLLFRGGLGFGDVKLMGLVGFTAGFPHVLLALMLGMVAGGVGAVFLLVFANKEGKDVIPYGPFLVFGAFLTLIWAEPIWDWYVGLLS